MTTSVADKPAGSAVARAGAIYRAARAGAVLPVAAADPALTAACDRIGIRHAELGVSALPGPAVPLRIALAGFGVVGQALAERLRHEPDFEIVSVLVSNVDRPRATRPPAPLTSSPDRLLGSKPDILVDALCCDDTGAFLAATALPRGIHIASASKRVVSAHHPRLTAAAATSGACFLYSAAVGGGAPVLETIDRARAAGQVTELVATLNGTVNFILDRLAAGASFDHALRAAQTAGFAEADSTADLSGADAAAKLRIAAFHAFGTTPASLDVTLEPLDEASLDRIASSGERWLQVARLVAGRHGPEASVRLQPAHQVGDLAAGPDEWNAATVRLSDGRSFSCGGRGAGGAPTAEAIVADLHDIAAVIAQRAGNAAKVASC